MDSQRQEDPFFIDLLQEGEQGFENGFMMATPHMNVDAHQSPPPVENQPSSPVEIRSTTKKSQRGNNFTIEEDNMLVSAWLNNSLDAVLSNDQKYKQYWRRIWLYFHNNKQFESDRSETSLSSRWSMIQLCTNKFCGVLAQIETLNPSGYTEQDKIGKAKFMYKELYKRSFHFEHCWVTLRHEAKWLEHKDNVKGRKRLAPITSSPTLPESIHLDEDNDESNAFVDLERPLGKKAEKERLKKRKSQDNMVSSLATKLDEIKEEKKKIHEEKMESMRIASEERRETIRIASEERRELIRLKKKKIEVENAKMENEIMMKDLSTMDPEQREFIRICRFEILESYKSKF
uniref:No apical meristem-associated C-terminal domain-containing protein n=1 Tax=Fagus sylvatica TaxID=28930 RepID=A0A2N9EEQ3_FAGSY